jgi:hypothetical protein
MKSGAKVKPVAMAPAARTSSGTSITQRALVDMRHGVGVGARLAVEGQDQRRQE